MVNEEQVKKKYGLVDGEDLINQMRPHFMCVLPQILLWVGVLVVTGVGLWFFSTLDSPISTNAGWITVGVVVVLLTAVTAKQFIWWLTTRYVFTNRRIITRSGLLFIKGETIPLNRIQSIQFEKTFVDRILGAGQLLVDSAAENDIVIKYVTHPEEIQRNIYAEVSRQEGEGFSPRNANL